MSNELQKYHQHPLKGKFPTNVAFGGNKGTTLFVTLQKRGAIEYFEVEDEGRDYAIRAGRSLS